MNSLLPGPRTTGVCFVLGAVLELTEATVSPLVAGSTTRNMAAIAAHQERFAVSATLGMVATLVFFPAFFGLMRHCSAKRPRLAVTSFWLILAQLIGYLAVRVTQGVQLGAVRQQLSPTRSAHLLSAVFTTPMVLPLGAMFLGVGAIAWVLMAVTAWRSGLRLGAALMVVFQAADLANFNGGHVGTMFSHVPLLLGAVAYAVALWSSADREAGGRPERGGHAVADRHEADLVAPRP